MTTAITPLDDAELVTLLAPLDNLDHVVIAVSGGPDSMALMAACARWNQGRARKLQFVVATVDHGLRPESGAEALLVQNEALRLGLRFELLTWQGDKPETGIQEAAREARYDLLISLCHRLQANALLTAHTLDDQAETIVMRLARGSGLSGLGGMEQSRLRDGITHLRPLLAIAKARLVASCREWGAPFIEDPSNDSARYTRVRWRKLMPELAREGLDAERLAIFAARMARADGALAVVAEQVFNRVAIASNDPIILDAKRLYDEPREIVIRVVARALCTLRPEHDHLRLQRLEDCVLAFEKAVKQGKSLQRTLGGTLLVLDVEGQLTLAPEPPRRRGRAPIC